MENGLPSLSAYDWVVCWGDCPERAQTRMKLRPPPNLPEPVSPCQYFTHVSRKGVLITCVFPATTEGSTNAARRSLSSSADVTRLPVRRGRRTRALLTAISHKVASLRSRRCATPRTSALIALSRQPHQVVSYLFCNMKLRLSNFAKTCCSWIRI